MIEEGALTDMIGDFLVMLGAMTREQLEDVLRLQKAGDSRMFGEIAISLGYIDDSALQRYVESRARDQKNGGQRAHDEEATRQQHERIHAGQGYVQDVLLIRVSETHQDE